MKIRCPKESLLAALQSASAVVPSRSPKPVLTNVKVEATRDAVVVMATDLEVGIRIELEGVETVAPGAVLLPSGRLTAIVRESPAGTVFDIHCDGTAALVKAPRSEFRLPAEDPLEFPAVATFPAGGCVELATPLVRELVRRTVFATDSESSRYALGGVLIEMTPAAVIAVGADGWRGCKGQRRTGKGELETPSPSCPPGPCNSWSGASGGPTSQYTLPCGETRFW